MKKQSNKLKHTASVILCALMILMIITWNDPNWQIELPIMYFFTLIIVLTLLDIAILNHFSLFCPNCKGLGGINLNRYQKLINSFFFGMSTHYGETCPVCDGWGYLRFLRKIPLSELKKLRKKYGGGNKK